LFSVHIFPYPDQKGLQFAALIAIGSRILLFHIIRRYKELCNPIESKSLLIAAIHDSITTNLR